jgi:NitT/TauT family transport system ATP-binding protein
MSAIELRGVWVEYGEQIVLERINLTLASGAFVSVVGPSGAGKSTLLRLLLGEECARDDPARRRTSAARTAPTGAWSSSAYSVFPHLTVLKNVLLAFEFGEALLSLSPARRGARRSQSESLIERSGCRRISTNIRAPAGGMQQRLAIAAARRRRCCLDEPFGA